MNVPESTASRSTGGQVIGQSSTIRFDVSPTGRLGTSNPSTAASDHLAAAPRAQDAARWEQVRRAVPLPFSYVNEDKPAQTQISLYAFDAAATGTLEELRLDVSLPILGVSTSNVDPGVGADTLLGAVNTVLDEAKKMQSLAYFVRHDAHCDGTDTTELGVSTTDFVDAALLAGEAFPGSAYLARVKRRGPTLLQLHVAIPRLGTVLIDRGAAGGAPALRPANRRCYSDQTSAAETAEIRTAVPDLSQDSSAKLESILDAEELRLHKIAWKAESIAFAAGLEAPGGERIVEGRRRERKDEQLRNVAPCRALVHYADASMEPKNRKVKLDVYRHLWYTNEQLDDPYPDNALVIASGIDRKSAKTFRDFVHRRNSLATDAIDTILSNGLLHDKSSKEKLDLVLKNRAIYEFPVLKARRSISQRIDKLLWQRIRKRQPMSPPGEVQGSVGGGLPDM